MIKKFEPLQDIISPYAQKKINGDFSFLYKVINDRGLEILSESAFLNWLSENGVKHQGEWDNEKEYVRLSVVLHEGKSYTSRKQVPAGIDILNEDFWVLTGNYNAQIELVDSRYKTFEHFGAVGDGVTDDTDAVENALNSNFEINGNRSKVYKINKTLRVNKNINIKNLNLKPDGAYPGLVIGNNAAERTTSLTSKVTPKQQTINVVNTTGINNGDIIVIKSDELWPYDNRGYLTKGELHKVAQVGENSIRLSEPVFDSYDFATNNIVIEVYKPITVNIENLEINYDEKKDTHALQLNALVDSQISNLKISNAISTGLHLSKSYNTNITNPFINDCTDEITGLGYGIQDNSSMNTIITNGHFYRNKRAIDFSGVFPARGFIVSNNIAVCYSDDVGDGFGTHGTAEFGSFNDNITYGGRYGFIIRGANIKVSNNRIYDPADGGIGHWGGDGIEVSNNYYHDARTNVKDRTYRTLPAFYVKTNTTENNNNPNIIKNNSVVGFQTSLIQLINQSLPNEHNLIVKGNYLESYAYTGSFNVSIVYSVVDRNLIKSVFKDNIIKTNGNELYFTDNITLDNTTMYDVNKLNGALEVWAGTGQLDNINISLEVSNNKKINVKGIVKFDVLNEPVNILLKGLPRPTKYFIDSALFYSGDIDESQLTFKNIMIQNRGGDLYLANSISNFNEKFPVGIDNVIKFDIEYEL